MTRNDFEIIAAALRDSQPAPSWCANKHAQYRVTVGRIADKLAHINPRFNRARFFSACGIDPASMS